VEADVARALLVLLLIVGALAVAAPSERLGRSLYAAGMPRLAGALLDGPAWRGATLYAQGRFAEAAQAFQGATFAAASYDEGTALARAGALGEAITALNDALYRDPNDEDARYNLALVEALKARRERQLRDAMNAANATATKQKRGGEAPSSAENEVNSTGEGAAGDRDSGRQANSPGRAQVTRAGRAQQSEVDWLGGEARGSVGAAEGGGRTGGDSSKVATSFDMAIRLPKKSYSQQTVHPTRQWLQTIPDDPGKFLRLKLAAERSGRAARGVAAPGNMDPW
jgi:Ca-activated chloride channel family protein